MNNYTDTGLDQFLENGGFGSLQKKKGFNSLTGNYKPMETNDPFKDDVSFSMLKNSGDEGAALLGKAKTATGKEGIDLSSAGAGLGDAVQAGVGVMGLISNAKGGQFDTDGAGDGVGKGGTAIMEGATQGMEAGGSIGKMIGGPMGESIGKAAGLLGGGLISGFAHKKAKGEWVGNKAEHNKDLSYLEKKKLDDAEYSGSQAESLTALKSLREKQLGIQ
jgi:hypothetical protein